jgi:hypothetical protein
MFCTPYAVDGRETFANAVNGRKQAQDHAVRALYSPPFAEVWRRIRGADEIAMQINVVNPPLVERLE